MVDAARLRALLERIREETEHLRRIASYSDEALAADPDRVVAAKYRFIVALDACIDAGEHIVAAEGLPAPSTFAEVFAALGQAGYLPLTDVPTLQAMARFRNLLVHGYAQVDDQRVIEILRTRLDDFDRFRAAIAHAAAD
jgi:uncharacterized protein YutE (UPF0331/DUF86 family)